jgi:hypothetical protein
MGALIALDSEAGRGLLAEAVTVDYAPLAAHYQGQRALTHCGVASGVIALNALLGEAVHSQRTFLSSRSAPMVDPERVDEEGMTLGELASLLASHGARITIHHALDATMDPAAFRRIARENLARSGDFLIVNYLRETLGQRSGGHFSPLAAYHAATDRFLVLDVADLRYSPVWVETELLFSAMATVDARCGRSRGFLAVSI